MKGPTTLAVASAVMLAVGCGGSGSSKGGSGDPDQPAQQVCSGTCSQEALSVEEVARVVAQAAREVDANGFPPATIAVVDHVGNVLVVFATAGADPGVETIITSGRGVTGGLEGLSIPATLAAISKAGTAAMLSSQGHGFSSRTASQIIQENFNPNERGQVGGPLFGVQFSQLPCGDLVRRAGIDALEGPKRLPLGFAADPGGLPLFKNGVPVGAVGVELDGIYTLDPVVLDDDAAPEERVATAATHSFETPEDRSAERIAVAGRFLRLADDEDTRSLPLPVGTGLPPGRLVAVPGFFDSDPLTVQPGVLFLTPASGIVTTVFEDLPAEILVRSSGEPRFPPTDSTLPPPPVGLSADEVRALLGEALRVAERTRAQIRRPPGSATRVSISVVDTAGVVLGIVRTTDAPPFGVDVSLQKARTSMFFSSPAAAGDLVATPDAPAALDAVPFGEYVATLTAFSGGALTLADGVAFGNRSVGNLARPFFPDGINGNPSGPLSRAFDEWSVFKTGIQLDLILTQLAIAVCPLVPSLRDGLFAGACPASTSPPRCTDVGVSAAIPAGKIANGTQIFPGGVPIYRDDTLIGGIGVSGDGVDQDDQVAFLSLFNAGLALESGIRNAPREIRIDAALGSRTRVRYVACPVAPFLDSTEQDPCSGK